MINDKKRLIIAVIGVSSILPANAIEPVSVVSGPVAVIPQIAVEIKHNDNLFLTETSAESSMITVLKPSVQLLAERANDAYRVSFSLEDGRYDNSRADDYTDYSLSAEAIIELNSRHRVNFSSMYTKDHEDRGSTNTATGDKPSEYTDKSVSLTYRYGAQDAIANLELTGSYLDHSFDNFKSINGAKDRSNTRFGGTFFYSVAPKTSALFELRYEDIDYDLATSSLDNIERKYLLGVQWDATAKTSGTAKFGYMEKEYDASVRNDLDGISWEIAGRWSPLTYSVFDISATQEFEEASGNEDAVDTQLLSISWSHNWNDRLSTMMSASRLDEDYSGISREDATDTLTFAVNYEVQRWVGVNLAFTDTTRGSDLSGEDYDNKQVMLSVSLSF